MDWGFIYLEPDTATKDSEIFRGLRKTQIQKDSKQPLDETLTCTSGALKFEVRLPRIFKGITSGTPARDRYERRSLQKALHNALATDAPHATNVRLFIRYSPWLLQHIDSSVKGEDPLLHHVALARLTTTLLAEIKEDSDLLDAYEESFLLLQRAQFLLLASLYEEFPEEFHRYFANAELTIVESWRTWTQSLVQHHLRLRSVLTDLAAQENSLESEGVLTLFSGSQTSKIWRFLENLREQTPTIGYAYVRSHTEVLVSHFFAPRYDLARIQQVLQHVSPLHRSRWRHVLGFGWFAPLVVVVCLLGLLAAPLAIGILPSRWLGAASQVTWGILAMGTILQTVASGVWPFRLQMPRITLAIIVGYLALCTSSELLQTAILLYEEHVVLMLVMIFATLSFSAFILYAEVRRHLSDHQAEQFLAWRRVGRVMLVAGFRSLVIGWLLLVPLGSLLTYGLFDGSSLPTPVAWPGWWGWTIYPQLILVYAPLAFLIGIIAQTIWERDSLTRPL